MKLLLIGIFFISLSTLTGSAFDTIAKYSSKLSFEWYHLFSLGNTFAIVVFLFFLNFVGGIKKHLILKKKRKLFYFNCKRASFYSNIYSCFYCAKKYTN